MKPIYKILILIGSVIVLGILAVVLWNSFVSSTSQNIDTSVFDVPPTLPISGQNPQSSTNNSSSSPTTQNPSGGTSNPSFTPLKNDKISENKAFYVWTVPTTDETYYLTPEGYIMALKEGPDIELSSQKMVALNHAEASPDRTKLLTSFGDPYMPQWGVFDIIDKTWRPLPDSILKAIWNSSSQELIALIKKGTQNALVRLDLSKNPPTQKTVIADFRLNDVRLISLSPQTLFISEFPSQTYAGRLWKLDLKTLTLNLLQSPAYGKVIEWTPNRSYAFVFQDKNTFNIVDGKTMSIMNPVPFSTLPHKCSLESGVVYCFVPRALPTSFVFPDDYFQNKFYTNDGLYFFNVQTGEFYEVTIPQNIDGRNPIIIGNNLYYTNHYDGYVYKIKLK